MAEREVRYCTTEDGVRIAYSVAGTGPAIVFVPQWVSLFKYAEYEPRAEALIRSFPGFRVVIYDRRGVGLSQRDVSDFSRQTLVKDVEAIFRVLSLKTAALLAFDIACPVVLEFAHLHPELVSNLVLFSPTAQPPAMHMAGKSLDTAQVVALVQLVRSAWDIAAEAWPSLMMPGANPDEARALQRALRESCTAESAAAQLRAAAREDMRELLPEIGTRTLVIHARADPMFPLSDAADVASLMPNARLLTLDFETHWSADLMEAIGKAARQFLEGEETIADSEPRPVALRTVLFTDLVGHTEMMSRLGDQRGRDVLREHERITREVLKANGGTEVKTMGDGFLASFGSVSKAVECAIALQKAIEAGNQDAESPLARAAGEGKGVRVRVGLNAGEPIEEDGDLFGATVILASRIAAKAEGGEILVADTVRGLCSGKGFVFADRGEFVAKGIEESVRVYEVSWPE